jgi:hypothetical protein
LRFACSRRGCALNAPRISGALATFSGEQQFFILRMLVSLALFICQCTPAGVRRVSGPRRPGPRASARGVRPSRGQPGFLSAKNRRRPGGLPPGKSTHRHSCKLMITKCCGGS